MSGLWGQAPGLAKGEYFGALTPHPSSCPSRPLHASCSPPSQENSRVSAIRDRIKAHLAAQGMIKGHAGSGSRSTIHDEYLRLSDPRDHDMEFRTGGSSASTDGSPNREQSVDSDYPYSTRVSLITPRYEGDYEDHRLLPSGRSPSPIPVEDLEFMNQFLL